MDPLDSMRVHPLQYKLAHAVAAHALHAPLTSEDALRDLTEPFRDGRDPEDRRGKEEIHTKRREGVLGCMGGEMVEALRFVFRLCFLLCILLCFFFCFVLCILLCSYQFSTDELPFPSNSPACPTHPTPHTIQHTPHNTQHCEPWIATTSLPWTNIYSPTLQQ